MRDDRSSRNFILSYPIELQNLAVSGVFPAVQECIVILGGEPVFARKSKSGYSAIDYSEMKLSSLFELCSTTFSTQTIYRNISSRLIKFRIVSYSVSDVKKRI